MNIREFEKLLIGFDSIAKETKASLSQLLALISDGKVPLKNDIERFDSNINILNDVYTAIVAASKEILPKEAVPETNSSVSEYASAVRENVVLVTQMKVQYAKQVLNDFLHVRSLFEAYTEAIKPYQDKARELLISLSSSDHKNIESVINDIKPTELFIKVLRCNDLDSDEGISILEEASEVFPRRVQLGLQGNKYYISDAVNVEDSVMPGEVPDENTKNHAESLSIPTTKTQAVDAENSRETAASDRTAPVSLNDDETTSDTASEDETNLSDDAPIDIISEKHSIITLSSIKRIKSSTPSATAFKKDILTLPKNVKSILPLFTNLGVMTARQVHLIGICMGCFEDTEEAFKDVVCTLELLTNKGYLAAYDLSNNADLAYCLTKYSNACLQKDSIFNGMRSFWEISFGSYRICGSDEMPQSLILNAIEETDNLLAYMYDVKKFMVEEDYEKTIESVKHLESGFQVGAFVNEEFILCIAASASSTKTNDYPLLFVESIPDAFDDYENVYVYRDGKVFGKNNINYADESSETAQCSSDPTEKTDDDSADKIVIPSDLNKTDRDTNEAETIIETIDRIEPVENEPRNDEIVTRLIASQKPPKDDELYDIVASILDGTNSRPYGEHSSVVQALMLAKAASFDNANKKCSRLYQQLLYATKIPLDEAIYTAENLSSVFTNEDDFEKTLMLLAYMFGMLVPGMAYDYSMKSQTDEFLRGYDLYFPHLHALKPLFAKLNTIRDVIAIGFTEGILSRIGSEAESEKYVKELQYKADLLLKVSAPKTRMKALPVLYSICFGKNSDLYECLEIISNNDTSKVELVNAVLEDYCDKENGSYSLSMTKMDTILNDYWFKANGQNTAFTLEYAARQQALRQITSRLEIIKSWSEHISIIPGSKLDLPRLKTLKNEIVQLARNIKSEIATSNIKEKNIIGWSLSYIEKYLSSPSECFIGIFDEFALTGIFTLDAKRIPITCAEMGSIKYYEPWRNVLRHITSPITSFEQAKAEILDGGELSDLFDNLRQLEVIGAITGEEITTTSEQIEEAMESAQDNATKFDETLELAYTYNRISETEKENLAGIKKVYMDMLLKNKDFGIWRQFLRALTYRIDELTENRKTELRRMLEARLSKPNGSNSPILEEAKNLLERDLNFAVAEEYINRFDNGESNFSEELQSVLQDKDHFSEFISDQVFLPIYNECSRKLGGNFQTFAEDYLKKTFPSDWTTRLKDDSIKLVKSWPIRKGNVLALQIKTLLSELGFNAVGAEKIPGKKEEIFKASLKAAPRSMADYRHPISAFGTQTKPQMPVIVLHGNIPAKQLVDTVTGMGLGAMAIVLLNYPLNLAVRRQIAEEFHKTTGDNPFILIDQVLAIYLAQHQITERLPIMLKCTLPFTTYQPFVRDGGSTADEMFCGRTRELATIKDPNGACIVYGGRQLGKTALLERAESLCFKPENQSFAVYCNILNCTTELNMVHKIVEDVKKKTGLVLGDCNTIQELTDGFEKLFKNGTIETFLLLLDETDKFLASIANQDYAQLQPLIDFKRSTQNKFKFVLAGLHNVCRAKNATAHNGVFGQLGTPLCIKPLSPTDALQLLSRPLRYLGFQIDRYPHLETILTQTNYYPGILQFFGYMLVETLSTHYGKYYRAVDGNPPYTLQRDQLGAVMNSADLNNSIRNKFRWSLELDDRYFMIARCIAVLYYLSEESTNTWLGFSIEEIMEIAAEYDIYCLKNTRTDEYKNLLDEMVEMGILSKPNRENNLYRLRRSSFIDIIGSSFDAVDIDIMKNNTEVEYNVSY